MLLMLLSDWLRFVDKTIFALSGGHFDYFLTLSENHYTCLWASHGRVIPLVKISVIPQAGSGGFAIAQISGGHADLAISHLPAARPQIGAGNVRFLAVMGGERAPGFEDVPTLKEAGDDVSRESCGTVMASPGIPKEAADKLARSFTAAANDPEYPTFLSGRFTNKRRRK